MFVIITRIIFGLIAAVLFAYGQNELAAGILVGIVVIDTVSDILFRDKKG